MPSQSHGRLCLVVAVCLVTLFAFVRFRYGHSEDPLNLTQYILSPTSPSDGIANSTLGFEKIFVINAPWRTDRKDALSLAASYSDIDLAWIDGVDADTLKEKAFPPGKHRGMSKGNLGSWRAHMDAMREIVAKNLTTALVLEDDADWDLRLRGQLERFSYAARNIPRITGLADAHGDRHPPASEDKKPDPADLAKRSSLPLIPFRAPINDPYGRDWDILWLGHCGADLPSPSTAHPNRFMLQNDETVPAPQHLKPTSRSPTDAIASLYPPNTRVYHRTGNSTLCTLAYAVTQTGARKILYQFGIRDLSKGYDFELSDLCAGLTRNVIKDGEKGSVGGMRRPMCVTVQPPLFSHFWSERGQSDIMGTGMGGRERVGSRYVRWSVRAGLEGWVRGKEVGGVQWEDDVH